MGSLCLSFRRRITFMNFIKLFRWYLTLNLLTWKIWWAPNNVSRWEVGFNSAFKGLTLTHLNSQDDKFKFDPRHIIQYKQRSYETHFPTETHTYQVIILMLIGERANRHDNIIDRNRRHFTTDRAPRWLQAYIVDTSRPRKFSVFTYPLRWELCYRNYAVWMICDIIQCVRVR